MIKEKGQKALFIDRDGTLIRDSHYLKDPDKVEAILGAGKVLQKVKEAALPLDDELVDLDVDHRQQDARDCATPCERRVLRAQEPRAESEPHGP